ncbi:hypothetical protein D3C76_1255890 [compost metagenome]
MDAVHPGIGIRLIHAHELLEAVPGALVGFAVGHGFRAPGAFLGQPDVVIFMVAHVGIHRRQLVLVKGGPEQLVVQLPGISGQVTAQYNGVGFFLQGGQVLEGCVDLVHNRLGVDHVDVA